MIARQYVINSLISDGHDEKAAESAIWGVQTFLLDRMKQLRADGHADDAVWFNKVLNEIAAR